MTRALRHERAGYGGRLVESSAELLDRLGFASIDEMEQWAEMVRALPAERWFGEPQLSIRARRGYETKPARVDAQAPQIETKTDSG